MSATHRAPIRRQLLIAVLVAALAGTLLPLRTATATSRDTASAPALPDDSGSTVPSRADRIGLSLADAQALDRAAAAQGEPEVGSVDRTPYVETTYVGDNRFSTTISAEPRFRYLDGKLVAADGAVTERGGRVLAPNAVAPVTFADGRDDSLASFDVGGRQVDMRAVGLNPTRAQLTPSGAVTVGTDRKGVSLQYGQTASTTKEEIHIASTDSPRSFEFFISDPSGALGTVTANPDGSYAFTGRDGLTASMPAAVAWEVDEADQRVASPTDGLVTSAHMEVSQVQGGFAVRTWLDDTWAANHSFPVVLDPTVTWAYGRPGIGTNGAAPVLAANVGRNENCVGSQTTCLPMFDYSVLYAGSVQDSQTNVSAIRTVLQWSYPEGAQHHFYDDPNAAPFNLPERAHIGAARLWLDNVGCVYSVQPADGQNCGSGTTVKPLSVHRLTYPVDSTWNWASINNFMAAASTTAAADAQTKAFKPPYRTFTGSDSTIFNAGNWQTLQIKDVVQGWVDQPTRGAGLVIRATDETPGNRGTGWFSNNQYNAMNVRPLLSVDWENYVPGKVRNLTATATGGSVKVDWDEPSTGTWADTYYITLTKNVTIGGTTVPIVVGYKEYKMLPSTMAHPPTSVTLPPTDFTFTGLPSGDYSVYMSSSNPGGINVPADNASTAVTVGATTNGQLFQPTSVTAVEGDSQASLTWTRPWFGSIASGISGYHVRAYANGGSTPAADLIVGASVGVAGNPAVITGLINGTSYDFTVTPQIQLQINGQPLLGYDIPDTSLVPSTSARSNPVIPFGRPFTPVIVGAVRGATSGTMKVTWKPPADTVGGPPGNNGRPISQYEVRVYRQDDDSFVKADPFTPPAGTTPSTVLDDTVGGLTNGTSYYAKVRAKNLHPTWSDESGRSGPVIPAGPPLIPQTPGVTRVPGGVRLTWTPPGDNGDPISGYTATATDDGGNTQSRPAPGSPFTFDGLVVGSYYKFSVTATNGAGSTTSLNTGRIQIANPPGAFTITNAVPHNGTIDVTWTQAAANYAGVTYTAIATVGSTSKSSTPTSGQSATIGGLDNGTKYTVKVVATNEVGSTDSQAIADVMPYGPPDAPQLSNITNQNASATVFWTTPATHGSEITGYRVTAVASGEAPKVYDVVKTLNSYTIGILTNGARYDVKVQALYADGAGPASATGPAWPASDANGTPRVDVIRTNGSTAQPCWRNTLSDGILYFCRNYTTGTYTVPSSRVNAVDYNRVGDVPPPDAGNPILPAGGGNYVVHTPDGLYEGCGHQFATNSWTCHALMTGHPSVEKYNFVDGTPLDFSKYWGMLADGTYLLAQVATCIGAIIVEGGEAAFGVNYSIQAITDSCGSVGS